jgi:hypothetical protein
LRSEWQRNSWTGGLVLTLLLAGCGGSGQRNSEPTITSVAVSPGASSLTVGTTQQFAAAVSGTGDYSSAVSWTVAGPSGWLGSAGSIDSNGLYVTPYPAPATVTVTATSTADTTKSASATVTLSAPAAAGGPVLTVDVGDPLQPISPLIYGANSWQLDAASAAAANFSVLRWGGDATSRYNYQLNSTSFAADRYFENFTGVDGAFPDTGVTASFSDFVAATDAAGMAAMGTVPVQGWVSNSNTDNNAGLSPACSFPVTTYPGQTSADSACGNGTCPNGSSCGTGITCANSGGCSLFGDASTAKITSVQALAPACTMNCNAAMPAGAMAASQTACIQTCSQANMPTPAQATAAWAQGTWAGGWVHSLVANPSYGNGASGKGVAFWDLDNEPAWWDGVHRDVHPAPSTYDEVTWGDIGTALAIKTADPTAKVDGPIIDFWWNYFYSKKDIESGWGTAPCYQAWDNPQDRTAHGGVPLMEYVLQQFKAAEAAYGMRLLDYLDIHAYYAGSYKGQSVASTTAGDTAEQQFRLNSTRAFWDPTYTDPDLPAPNYPGDPNYTSDCSQAGSNLQPPQIVPLLRHWVNTDYPGTGTAVDEYNFGGLEHINGALAQADLLGIFGQYGLDMATLWPTSSFLQQVPGNMAFAIYRNYDGHDAEFGDTALASCSTAVALSGNCDPTAANAADETGQGQLSVYGALRSSDNAVTVVVINKTFGDLNSTLSLPGLTGATSAHVWQYSAADLAKIDAQPDVTLTPPTGTSTSYSIAYSFPASSITLFVIPQ